MDTDTAGIASVWLSQSVMCSCACTHAFEINYIVTSHADTPTERDKQSIGHNAAQCCRTFLIVFFFFFFYAFINGFTSFASILSKNKVGVIPIWTLAGTGWRSGQPEIPNPLGEALAYLEKHWHCIKFTAMLSFVSWSQALELSPLCCASLPHEQVFISYDLERDCCWYDTGVSLFVIRRHGKNSSAVYFRNRRDK